MAGWWRGVAMAESKGDKAMTRGVVEMVGVEVCGDGGRRAPLNAPP